MTLYIPHSNRPTTPLQKAIAIVGTAVAGTVALMFSAVLLSILAAVAVVGGGYLWWRTRAMRRQMREQMEQMRDFAPQDGGRYGAPFQGEAFSGEIIEGEVVRVTPAADRLGR